MRTKLATILDKTIEKMKGKTWIQHFINNPSTAGNDSHGHRSLAQTNIYDLKSSSFSTSLPWYCRRESNTSSKSIHSCSHISKKNIINIKDNAPCALESWMLLNASKSWRLIFAIAVLAAVPTSLVRRIEITGKPFDFWRNNFADADAEPRYQTQLTGAENTIPYHY